MLRYAVCGIAMGLRSRVETRDPCDFRYFTGDVLFHSVSSVSQGGVNVTKLNMYVDGNMSGRNLFVYFRGGRSPRASIGSYI